MKATHIDRSSARRRVSIHDSADEDAMGMGAEGEIFQSRATGTGRKGDGERWGEGGEMGEVCARREWCVGLHRETTGDTSRARRRIDAREGRG